MATGSYIINSQQYAPNQNPHYRKRIRPTQKHGRIISLSSDFLVACIDYCIQISGPLCAIFNIAHIVSSGTISHTMATARHPFAFAVRLLVVNSNFVQYLLRYGWWRISRWVIAHHERRDIIPKYDIVAPANTIIRQHFIVLVSYGTY